MWENMYVEEIAAYHLKKFIRRLDEIGLRVYTYGMELSTKTKKRVSNILFGVISNYYLIEWLIDRLGIENVDRNLLRVIVYRLVVERNREVMNRVEQVGGIDLEDLYNALIELVRKIEEMP